MKYKKKLENLKRAQSWFDSLPQSIQATMTRPGSIKCFSTAKSR